MTRRLPLIVLFAGLALLAACGSDSKTSSGSPGTTTASGSASTATSTAAASASTIKISETSLGPVVVDGTGMTLYVFTPDTGTTSTCNDACASAWPALKGPATAGDGVDSGDLGTTTRSDGSVQVTFYGHPLYHYSGDGAPGDVSGQGSGGKWFVVDATGASVTGTGSTTTTTTAKAKASSGY
jgi:predicted lipoprotein with Yx(FWY)xxD motif